MVVPSSEFVVAAQNLKVDAVTSEVVRALRSAGIAPILLKGPSTAHRLGDAAPRPYVDSDLLVPPNKLARAERILGELGFQKVLDAADALDEQAVHAHTWVRTDDRASVDLHWALPGVSVSPAAAWEALRADTAALAVGGTQVDVLGAGATALLLALHAAYHGTKVAKPVGELRRAVERIDGDVWREAAALADELGATPALSVGLRLLPEGAALADELGLPRAESVGTVLRAATPPPGALALDQLVSAGGLRAKASVVVRRLVPPRGYMRVRSRRAREGRRGALAAAYAWRLASIPFLLAPAVRAWRRARRGARR